MLMRTPSATLFLTETHKHPIVLTLQSQTSIKDITVSIKADFWPHADREKFPLGSFIKGKIMGWARVADGRLKIMWPDGYDVEDLPCLLAPAFMFSIVCSATGGPVVRRGGSHGVPTPGAAAQVPAAKVKVTVPYKIGMLSYEQVWEVEKPDAIVHDWRTAERQKPTPAEQGTTFFGEVPSL